jgi:hypothetical protein
MVVLAGCGGAGYERLRAWAESQTPSAPVEAAPGEPVPADALDLDRQTMPSPWRTGLVGAEFGVYHFTDDDVSTWFDDASYGGVKLSWEPGLNWGVSLSAGYYEGRSVVEGGEDITVFPVRATLELGGLMFFTQSRWFVGGGGGYAIMDALPSEGKVDLWPLRGLYLDGEWAAHAVGGFEFRNESIMVLRAEAGYTWMLESDADVWMVTGTLSLHY